MNPKKVSASYALKNVIKCVTRTKVRRTASNRAQVWRWMDCSTLHRANPTFRAPCYGDFCEVSVCRSNLSHIVDFSSVVHLDVDFVVLHCLLSMGWAILQSSTRWALARVTILKLRVVVGCHG